MSPAFDYVELKLNVRQVDRGYELSVAATASTAEERERGVGSAIDLRAGSLTVAAATVFDAHFSLEAAVVLGTGVALAQRQYPGVCVSIDDEDEVSR